MPEEFIYEPSKDLAEIQNTWYAYVRHTDKVFDYVPVKSFVSRPKLPKTPSEVDIGTLYKIRSKKWSKVKGEYLRYKVNVGRLAGKCT